jgi:hypothetical protein
MVCSERGGLKNPQPRSPATAGRRMRSLVGFKRLDIHSRYIRIRYIYQYVVYLNGHFFLCPLLEKAMETPYRRNGGYLVMYDRSRTFQLSFKNRFLNSNQYRPSMEEMAPMYADISALSARRNTKRPPPVQPGPTIPVLVSE